MVLQKRPVDLTVRKVPRLDLILNDRVLTELTTAMGIADEFWVVASSPALKVWRLLQHRVKTTSRRWFKSSSRAAFPDSAGSSGALDTRQADCQSSAARILQAQTLRWLVRAAEQAVWNPIMCEASSSIGNCRINTSGTLLPVGSVGQEAPQVEEGGEQAVAVCLGILCVCDSCDQGL